MKIKEITVLSPGDKTSIVDDFCKVVTSTMGPGGRPVMLSKYIDGIVHVTKDGVTVSEAIHSNNPLIRDIINLIKESARKTAKIVGDGTTTSILLVQAFVEMAYKLEKTIGYRKYYQTVDEIVTYLCEYLDDIRIDTTPDIIKAIANIACDSNKILTDLVTTAADLAGEYGVINVELTDNLQSNISSTTGCLIVNASDAHTKVELDNPLLLLVEGRIEKPFQLEQVLLKTRTFSRPIVIIAQEFSDSVKRIASLNRGRFNQDGGLNGVNMFLVEAEGFASRRLELLSDISAVTDTTIYSTNGATSFRLQDFQKNSSTLGSLEKAIVAPHETILIPSNYEEEDNNFDSVISAIKQQLHTRDLLSDEERFLKQRLSKYAVTAVIHVGAPTKAAAVEIKDKIDDAVMAIESAVNYGVVPGGGSALYKIRDVFVKKFKNTIDNQLIEGFLELMEYPFLKMLDNAGITIDEGYVEKLSKADTVYDFINEQYSNAIDSGIVDPAMILGTALINASTIAKTIMQSNYHVDTNVQETNDTIFSNGQTI